MLKQKIHLPYNSIRFKIFLPILLTMFPLFCFVFYYNYYAVKVVHNQVADSNKNLLTISMNHLDNQLQIMQTYLSDLASLNTDVTVLQTSTDSIDNIYTVIRIKNKLMADISMFKPMNCIFVFNINTGDFIPAFSSDMSYTESQTLSDYYTNNFNQWAGTTSKDPSAWRIIKIGHNYYLHRIIHILNIYAGACTKIENLTEQLDYPNKMKDVTLVVLDEDRKPTSAFDIVSKYDINLSGSFASYYISGKMNRYLVLGNPSKQGKFSLVALIPDKVILENLPFIQMIVYLIIAFSLISLTLILIYLRRIVIYPLNKLTKTMKVIREGNIDTRIPPFHTTDEFHIVNDTFNNMMDQIKQLKINIYEDQVIQQREELRRLQLEINPHFFLNSLNIIYNFAETHDYGLIKEMTLCLLKYFRFIFYSNRNCITLKEELEHVHNYIRIQELRYPESFQYAIDVPETLLGCLVPPLILQTFVENTNKYALNLDDFIILTIQISQEIINGKQILKIVVKDTGRHIDENILNDINAGKKIIDKNGGVHTGIWNLQNRLRLLYAGDSSIKVENRQPKGVAIEVTIPVNMKEEEAP